MTFARTKIQAPRPRLAFVERGALQAQLAEALLTRRVVLLCAPAGYGKTMLLVQQIARLPESQAAAWISADAGDDLQRLLECMLAALEPFDPPWRTAPEALVARVGRAAEERAVAAEFINTLDACDVPHGVIVLDDVHRVDDPAFFRFLDLVIERLSPRWTVALTSRTEPPLSLARLRAAEELAEFRQLQLQFARDEARALAIAAGLDEATADRVFDRTQGWPAGMRIAIGAVRAGETSAAPEARPGGRTALERALRAGERPIFEFLTTEVLDELRPELSEFLLRVSVLPELEASRCEIVSGNPNAAALLDEIERLGLFVDVLDAPVRTLRLHDLFRDAMQQRLQLRQPALLAELRSRAAATEPDPVRRITLLLDAGELDEAARLVFTHVPSMVATAGPAGAQHLIGQFPAAFRERSPELSFVRGLIGWVHWDFSSMLAHFERAEAAYAAGGRGDRELLARAYRAMALIALGRLDKAAAALASLGTLPLPIETRIVMLNALSWLAIDTGRLRIVAPLVDEMIGLLEKVDRLDLWYQTTPPNRLPGLPGVNRPLLRHAALLLRVAGDEPTPLRALAMLAQAWCAVWQGQLAEAHGLAERAREDAEWSGNTGAVRGHLLAVTAVVHALRGDSAAATEAALMRVRELQAGYSEWGHYVLLMFAARIAAICDDVPALRDTLGRLDAAGALLRSADTAARMRPQGPVVAQLAWLEGRADDAIAGWQDALAHEEEIDLLGQAVETRVRLARALTQRGDLADAARLLAPVFGRVQAEGAPGGALLAVDALRELAAVRWADALRPAEHAQLRGWWQLLASERARHVRPTDIGSSGASPAPTLNRTGEGLTPRELDVLARIAAGDSNKVIARALDLSPHTVKRHVANILGKLDLGTRGQAAAWYRDRHR